MDKVEITQEFDGDVEAMVRFCRSLESRKCWPGSVLEWERDDTLYYGVGMRLSAATMTDITVEERLSPVEVLPSGQTRFTTIQRITWPQGHDDAHTEYLFTPHGQGASHTLRLAYAYVPPSTKLVKPKNLPTFKKAMEKVTGHYLRRLATQLAASKAAPHPSIAT